MAMAADLAQAEMPPSFLNCTGWRLIPPSQQAEHHRQEEQDERKKAHKDRKL